MQTNKELLAIFEYLEKERGIKQEVIVSAIKESLLNIAKKKLDHEHIEVNIDPKTYEIEVVSTKRIVDAVEDPRSEISLEEALELEPTAETGQDIEIVTTPEEFGRIAAQTARQIITQRLKMAERDVIYSEYRDRVGEIISGTVERFVRGRNVLVNLGKVVGLMPMSEYPKTERFAIGESITALLLEVRDTEYGGAEVILSRSSPLFVEALFKQEVPELMDKTITIEKIVREPGYRTKIAVSSSSSNIDPVGTCVGRRGNRITQVLRALHQEKLDVIPYSDDLLRFLADILHPIQIKKVKEADSFLSIVVDDEDFPIVMGKRKANVALISKMIETELEVQKLSEYQRNITMQMENLSRSDDPYIDQPLQIDNVSSLVIEELKMAGFDTIRKLVSTSPRELINSVPGFNYFEIAEHILAQIYKKTGIEKSEPY